jgi:hypothetical protein
MISRVTILSLVTIIACYATGSATWHYRNTQLQQQSDSRQSLLRSTGKTSIISTSSNHHVQTQGNNNNRMNHPLIARSISRTLKEKEQLVSIGKHKINMNQQYLNIQLKYWISAGAILLFILLAILCCYYRFCCMICSCCCCICRRRQTRRNDAIKSSSSSSSNNNNTPSVTSDEPKSTSATIASYTRDASISSDYDNTVIDSSKGKFFNNKKLPGWSNTSSSVIS